MFLLAISHFQLFSSAIKDGLKKWQESHPDQAVPKDVITQITDEAKRITNEARRNS